MHRYFTSQLIKVSWAGELRTEYEQRTDSTGGNTPQSHASNGLETKSITCRLNHEQSHQDSKILSESYSSVDVSNQTAKEWLEDYNSLD
jgi:hypothetical protein